MGALAALVGLALLERCAALKLVERNASWQANDTWPANDTDSEIARFMASASEPLLAIDVDGIGFQRAGVKREIRINGEPMSGTSWIQQIVYGMLMNACFGGENCTLHQTAFGISLETLEGILELRRNDGKHEIPEVGHRNGVDFTNPPHLRRDELWERAKFMLDNTPTDRIWIAIFRDPRSVALSTCYHMRMGCPSPDEFTMKYIKKLSAWISIRYGFWQVVKNLDPSRVKILFFDDLKTEPAVMAGEIAAFLELETDVELAGARIARGDPFKSRGGGSKLCNFLDELNPTTSQLVTNAMNSVLNPILQAKWKCDNTPRAENNTSPARRK